MRMKDEYVTMRQIDNEVSEDGYVCAEDEDIPENLGQVIGASNR